MAFGAFSTLDTLASSQQSVVQYGEDRAFADIQRYFEIQSRIVTESLAGLAERSTDRQRRYGGNATMAMQEVDEFGRSDAQKVAAGVTVGFPLRLYDISVQWTKKALQNMAAAELAAQATAAAASYRTRMQTELKKALFNPTNYTFADHLVDNVELAVKRLVNADSAAIPLGPNGETFNGASHTHYIARVSTLAATDIDAVLNTVIEHHPEGTPMLYIGKGLEASIRGFNSAGQFLPYQPVTIMPSDDSTRAVGRVLTGPTDNRAIGIWGNMNTEVWVKPWIPANYAFAWVMGAPPPLVFRTREAGGGGLEVAAEDELHPLRAKTLDAEYGFGVWTRTNGAILYTGGTSYVAPTL